MPELLALHSPLAYKTNQFGQIFGMMNNSLLYTGLDLADALAAIHKKERDCARAKVDTGEIMQRELAD